MAIIKRQKEVVENVIDENVAFFDSLENGSGGLCEKEVLHTLATEKRILNKKDNERIYLMKCGEQNALKKLTNQVVFQSNIFKRTKFLFLLGLFTLGIKLTVELEAKAEIQYNVMAGLDMSKNNVLDTLKLYRDGVHESIFFVDTSIIMQNINGVIWGLMICVPILFIAYLISCWNSEELRKTHLDDELKRISKKENKFAKLKEQEKWSDEVAEKTLALYLMSKKYTLEDLKNSNILEDIINGLQNLSPYECWKIKRKAKFVMKFSEDMFPELSKT